ncbi:hypothetical protein ACFFRR_011848 [Megaselia abdita]
MKAVILLAFAISALHASHEIYTYFDLIHSNLDPTHPGLDWRPCCNTTFHSRELIIRESIAHVACKKKFPNDINCFTTCFLNAEGIIWEPVNGFHVNAIKRRIGSITYPDNDWKTVNADQIIDDCIEETPQNLGFVGCNPDIRTFANCYWNKMFQTCPDELKNPDSCLY